MAVWVRKARRGGGAVCRPTGGSRQAWCRGSRAEDTGAGTGVGRPGSGLDVGGVVCVGAVVCGSNGPLTQSSRAKGVFVDESCKNAATLQPGVCTTLESSKRGISTDRKRG